MCIILLKSRPPKPSYKTSYLSLYSPYYAYNKRRHVFVQKMCVAYFIKIMVMMMMLVNVEKKYGTNNSFFHYHENYRS